LYILRAQDAPTENFPLPGNDELRLREDHTIIDRS